eukprot:Skav207598  [mRNA]  locus=scaffold2450:139174:146805:+ [translate_table: standard]
MEHDASDAPKPEDAQVACRICLARDGELLAPCPCRGSLRFAHLECLKKEPRDLRKPREAREADWGSKTVGTFVAADHLGRVLSAAGRLEEAEQHLRRAVDGLQEAPGRLRHATLRGPGDAWGLLAPTWPLEAEPLLREALEGLDELKGEDLGEAEPLARRAWEVLNIRDLFVPVLTWACCYLHENEESLIPLRLSFEGRQKLLGPEHLRSLASAHNLGVALAELHEVDEAKKLLLVADSVAKSCTSRNQLPTSRDRQAAWEGRAQKLGAVHFRTLASAKRLLPRQLLFEAEAVLAHALALAQAWEICAEEAQRAAEEAEAESTSAGASEDSWHGGPEDERPCDERAARLLQ